MIVNILKQGNIVNYDITVTEQQSKIIKKYLTEAYNEHSKTMPHPVKVLMFKMINQGGL